MNVKMTRHNLTMNSELPRNIHTNAAIFIGKTQYPSTQTDWKHELLVLRYFFTLFLPTIWRLEWRRRPRPGGNLNNIYTQMTTKIVAKTTSLPSDEPMLRVLCYKKIFFTMLVLNIIIRVPRDPLINLTNYITISQFRAFPIFNIFRY